MKSPKKYLDFKRKDKDKKSISSAAQRSQRDAEITKSSEGGNSGK